MKKKKYERLNIDIDNILLDQNNPRAKAANSQIDEIQKIIRDSGSNGIVSLAKSLIEEDQNPLVNVGVVKDAESGKYIVLEGNRRLTALKLMNNPNLAEDSKTRNAIERLLKKHEPEDIPSFLYCVVFENRDDATEWIRLTHTGENDGVGVKRWKTNQQRRFEREAMGLAPDRSDMVAEYLQDNPYFRWDGDADSLYDINNITTLQRILGFRGMLDVLHLREAQNGSITSVNDEFSAKVLHEIYTGVDSGRITARNVYTSEEALAYVGKIAEKFQDVDSVPNNPANATGASQRDWNGDIPANVDKLTEPQARNSNTETSETVGPERRATPGGPNLSTRKKIVSKATAITGVYGKASEVLKELKNIQCNKCPIASALIIRCFYELTAKMFIDAKGIEIEAKYKSHLGELFFKCRERIISNGTEKEKENANKFTISEKKGKHVIEQLEELNNIIHDTDVVREKIFFFTTWDTFRPFIQDLWNNITEEEEKKK